MAFAVHNHSEFSALDGFSTVKEIADRVEQAQLAGAGITDHGLIAGWRPFAKEMSKRGLNFALGVEAYQAATHRKQTPEKRNQRDSYHLVLLAQSERGMKNIMRMVDEANRSGFYYHPRLDWELLEKYNEDVICTSACIAGLSAKAVQNDDLSDIHRYRRIFGDRFFVELHTYDHDDIRQVNLGLLDACQTYGIPYVYANDAHYAFKSQYPFHEIMLCMQMMKSVDDEDRMTHPPCLYIMSEQDVRASLSYLPDSVVDEAIRNSDLIAQRTQVQLPETRMHLPVFSPRKPTADSNRKLLIDEVEKGCIERYGEITDDVADRAEAELEAIFGALSGQGLQDYFLITQDFCLHADEIGIERGPGRGSAGGSLVAYALGITDVDPLEYGLYFERFYNAGRDEGLPDIDIDFEQERRAEIDEYFKERYGEYHFASIGTHIRMKPKAVIDKVGKALGVPYSVLTNIKKVIDQVPDINIISADQIAWHPGEGIKVAVWEHAEEELTPYRDDYPDLFECADIIGGRISTFGVHASAVVVSDVDLREELPCMNRAPRDDQGNKGERVLATMVEMKEVEACGFPKFDRLGLKTLDITKDVRLSTGGWNWRDVERWDELPEDFWTMMDKGRTLGLFQVEEGMARKIAKSMKPRSILDLAAIVALNRPGPLRTGVADRLLRRRRGEMDVEYLHPMLEPILQETYGDFLYQEQVLAYFRAIGYNLSEADAIRKMLGKKLVVEMEKEFPRYLERACKFMEEHVARAIWDNIIDFSKYSFNKAHAVCYAIILARSMYCKWRYPDEFIMACIKVAPDRVGDYVMEGRRIGVPVHAPDINRSKALISKQHDGIWFGLRDVKGVGEACALWLLGAGPYESYGDFLKTLDQAADDWKKEDKQTRSARSPRQVVPAGMTRALYNAGAFDSLEERQHEIDKDGWFEATLTEDRKFQLQEELLGVVLSQDIEQILAEHEDTLRRCSSIADLDESVNFEEVLEVPGVVVSIRPIVARTGKAMGFVKIEWEGDEVEFSVRPDHWQSYKSWMLKPRVIGIWHLKRNERGVGMESAEKLMVTGGK